MLEAKKDDIFEIVSMHHWDSDLIQTNYKDRFKLGTKIKFIEKYKFVTVESPVLWITIPPYAEHTIKKVESIKIDWLKSIREAVGK